MKMTDENKELFISKLCDEFKAFVMESADEHSEFFEDHLDYLKAGMETFIELKAKELE